MTKGLNRLVLPAAACGGVLLVAFVLHPATPGPGTATAALCMAAAFLLTVPLARSRRSSWTFAPALAFLPAIFYVKELETPLGSGVTAFILLPVLWTALHGSSRDLGITVIGVAAYFLLPIVLIGGPEYPESRWSRGLVVPAVVACAGLIVQRLVGQGREQAQAAVQRQADLERLVDLLAAIGRADDVRGAVCDAAKSICGARACLLFERDAEGRLVATAGAGAPAHGAVAGPAADAIGRALTTGRAALVADPAADDGPGVLAEALGGARSIAIEPVVGPAVEGALVVGWEHPVERRSGTLALLAAHAVSAIARADLLGELESLALHDPLTGLPNRRAWDEALSAAVARADRDGRPLSVALLDLDAFKQFNDAHGHQAGDRLLKAAAAAWQGELREGDVLTRWGGDEFALLLVGEPLKSATAIVERVLGAIPQHGCSAGVAEWNRNEAGDGLLARADAELYAAKAARRSRQSAT